MALNIRGTVSDPNGLMPTVEATTSDTTNIGFACEFSIAGTYDPLAPMQGVFVAPKTGREIPFSFTVIGQSAVGPTSQSTLGIEGASIRIEVDEEWRYLP
jgi:hypothetical protein